MSLKLKFFFYFFLFLLGQINAIAPKDYKNFKKISKRLLSNRQYSYFVEYFDNYAKLFSSNDQILIFALESSLYLSQPKNRIKLLSLAANLKIDSTQKNLIYHELGLCYLLENKEGLAITSFKKSIYSKSYFHLALIYYDLNDYKNSGYYLIKFFKSSKEKKDFYQRALLLKAQLFYHDKRFRDSFKVLQTTTYHSLESDILYYQLYNYFHDKKKFLVLKEIKRNYPLDPKAVSFLKNIQSKRENRK